eukprot:TRINITY_DN2675_c0_g1_i1.p2 TRINITY_DN2675_c0_g1~~TRINITY_DN2675_c0_g1_i1.p2  ORF type:complete len:182 (+),score=57.74 TRINITY_DN2675_c0_g1_i1:31-576(+)
MKSPTSTPSKKKHIHFVEPEADDVHLCSPRNGSDHSEFHPFVEGDTFNIHFGMLKVGNSYSTDFTLDNLTGYSIELVEPINEELGLQLTRLEPSSDPARCDLRILLHTNTEHSFSHRFELLLKSQSAKPEDEKLLHVDLSGQVLGRLQGTPMLKSYVKHIGCDQPVDSDVGSEWEGFEKKV